MFRFIGKIAYYSLKVGRYFGNIQILNYIICIRSFLRGDQESGEKTAGPGHRFFGSPEPKTWGLQLRNIRDNSNSSELMKGFDAKPGVRPVRCKLHYILPSFYCLTNLSLLENAAAGKVCGSGFIRRSGPVFSRRFFLYPELCGLHR